MSRRIVRGPFKGPSVKVVKRKMSPGMAEVARDLVGRYGVPLDRIHDEEFYLVDHLTGQPVVKKKKPPKIA